jgi:hypothetical protein
MDHHCPWLLNCVGFDNRKYFILTLFYTFLTVILALCVSIPFLWGDWAKGIDMGFESINTLEFCFANIATVQCLILVGILIPFGSFHVDLINKNSSTLDNLEEKRQGGSSAVSYDMGLEFNWVQVMGKNKLAWPLPYIGDAGNLFPN